MSWAKRTEPVEMPFGADSCGSRFPSGKGSYEGAHAPAIVMHECIVHPLHAAYKCIHRRD